MNPSSLVGYRLREERERLGLKQSEIAELAGVSREMWGRYERGALPGSEVLIALASIKSPEKLDVLYVITGQRSAPQEMETLPPDERIMLDNYRHAPPAVQAGVKTTLGAFAPASGRVKAD